MSWLVEQLDCLWICSLVSPSHMMTFLRAVNQCLGSLEPCDSLSSEVESSKVGPPYHTLLSEALRNLPSIRSTYLDQFSAVLSEKAVIKSRWVRWVWLVSCGRCGQ